MDHGPVGGLPAGDGLLRAVGERVSLHQDWLQAVSDSRGGGEHADSVCGDPVYAGGDFGDRHCKPGEAQAPCAEKGSWGIILKLAACQTVLQYLFFYIGLANASGVKSSIIEGANVFISILVASLVFRQERFTGQKILGCLVGFAGVVLVNWTKDGLDRKSVV